MDAVAQTDIAQRLRGAFFARFRIDAGIDQRQLDIAQAGGAREQIERLKNKSDLAIADRGEFVVIHLGDILAVEFVAPGSRRIETAEHVHESGFAAAARAHDGEIFVAMNLERNAAQRVHSLFAHHVIFRDVLDVDDDRTAAVESYRSACSSGSTIGRARLCQYAQLYFLSASFSIVTFAPSFSFRLIAL